MVMETRVGGNLAQTAASQPETATAANRKLRLQLSHEAERNSANWGPWASSERPMCWLAKGTLACKTFEMTNSRRLWLELVVEILCAVLAGTAGAPGFWTLRLQTGRSEDTAIGP